MWKKYFPHYDKKVDFAIFLMSENKAMRKAQKDFKINMIQISMKKSFGF